MSSNFRPFHWLFKTLLITLPFHVLLSVFLQFKVGIPGISIYKEVLLGLLGLSLIYEFIRAKVRPKFDTLDFLIFGYIGYLVLISLLD